MANFTKNDNGFICENCGKQIKPLGYTSRDHCTSCLCSIHVDIMPGDRANPCLGLLVPVNVEINSKKGYVINYKCSKCNQLHNNKAAEDDKFSTILSIMKGTYNNTAFKK